MKTKTPVSSFYLCLLSFAFCFPVLAQGTAFTYQERLNKGTNPANGIYDLRFTTPAAGRL